MKIKGETMAKPLTRADFEIIYNRNRTCTNWYCGQRGAILAYDDFSPEFAHWFCEDCWDEMDEMEQIIFNIVENHRDPFQGYKARRKSLRILALPEPEDEIATYIAWMKMLPKTENTGA
jgi:hypothetical protein